MRICSWLLVGLASISLGQVIDKENYVQPPSEIAEFINLPRQLSLGLGNLSPAKDRFMVGRGTGMVSLADLSKTYENLAGLMIDSEANRARTYTLRGLSAIVFRGLNGVVTHECAAPKDATFSNPVWSADGKSVFVVVLEDDKSSLGKIDAATGKLGKLTNLNLLLTGTAPVMSGDGRSMFAVVIPDKRPGTNKKLQVPSQPRVQVADPAKNNLRTYRTLLKNQNDQDRLEYYLTGQLVKIDLNSGRVSEIGNPRMIDAINPAPKGDFVRVTSYQKPFSYIVPLSNFGSTEQVWDLTGKSLVTLTDRKLRSGETNDDGSPTPPVDPSGRRLLSWSPDGNGFTYVTNDTTEAKPAEKGGGESDMEQGRRGVTPGAAATARKEKLVRWIAPFGKDNIQTLYKSETGFGTVIMSSDSQSIFYTETKGGVQSAFFGKLDKPTEKSTVWTWKTSETDKNPGTPVQEPNANGVSTLKVNEGKAFLKGSVTKEDASFDTPQPWLDRIDLATGKTERLWQSPTDAYETLDSIFAPDGSKLIIDRQTPTEVANSWLVEGGKRTVALTEKKDLSPDLTQAHRYRIQVTRADGFKFWVKVTTPRWHTPGNKLPAFFWFYPSEFENQDAYDRTQRNRNKNLFPTVTVNSKVLLVRRGYAVVEPDCPIVGPKGRINDFYVNDLRNSLSATIDTLEKEGLADRTRLGIGGHSYGGFSTANAMVHTPFFKAGIAGAGNFNRTLTPMAFQSETRSMFEARDTYLSMSPILYAENLSGALLMYCGMDDQNVGTDPINSERMFSVLESIGKTTALYMYPYEDHGQVARETLQDMWARHIAWLDKYVKGEKK